MIGERRRLGTRLRQVAQGGGEYPEPRRDTIASIGVKERDDLHFIE